jgi:hypothetical protein
MQGGDGKLKYHAGACCGLFCCAAITGDSGATVVRPDVRNFIGAAQKSDLAGAVRKLAYMPMGSSGMAMTGEMEMPAPANTLPMMIGCGQFGPIEMGGMFSLVKIREGRTQPPSVPATEKW